MNQSTTEYVGLAVHKDSIDIGEAKATCYRRLRTLGPAAGGDWAMQMSAQR